MRARILLIGRARPFLRVGECRDVVQGITNALGPHLGPLWTVTLNAPPRQCDWGQAQQCCGLRCSQENLRAGGLAAVDLGGDVAGGHMVLGPQSAALCHQATLRRH